MTAELAVREGLPGEKRRDGYTLPADLSYDEWVRIRDLVEYIVEASPWWLVDTVHYGEVAFPGQYSQSLPTAEEDPRGIRQARLSQASWMAQKFPPGSNTRVTGLSYTHHRAVAELEPDDRTALLHEAVALGLSTRALIVRVQERQASISSSVTAGNSAPICAADAPWQPTKDDLLPEHRAALERAALDADTDDSRGFLLGAMWALRYVAAEACFEPDRWRD